ncbi:hypothetical protein OVA24_18135 [Luteolibacter sp. SL250]|uniref:hypothetical protein n=1 Tax=Luteolibacter sp. SL250 TaxID=2995170 RepID=UPI00226E6F3F|nr:hypothetical protein [Luteolibacter sp. SL250]WAC19149.1 hypothetical protein OVA24_18135 [Luteolibacter sp. SL250]
MTLTSPVTRPVLGAFVATILATATSQAITTLVGAGVTGDPFLTSPGAAGTSTWNDLNASALPGYGGFPGFGAWPSPISSQGAGDNSASLTKVSGAAYPASGSIYFGGTLLTPNTNGAQLSVNDSTPVSGLTTIVFQIQFGEAMGYDFYNNVEPVLSFTAGAQGGTSVAATYSGVISRFDNGTFDPGTGPEPLYTNTYGFQWDLSGITEPITGFNITFNGVQHSSLYGMKLEQFDQNPGGSLIPEPSFALLGGLGGLLLLRRKK